MNRAGLWLPIAILLLPTVAAVAGEGEFSIEGGTFLPTEAEIRLQPLAVFTNDTRGLHDLRLEAGEVRLTEYEERFVVGAPGPMGVRVSEDNGPVLVSIRTLHDVHLHLSEASREGTLGIYPGPAALARLLSASAPVIEGRAETHVGNQRDVSGGEADRSDFYYEQNLRHPHLLVHAQGTLLYEGAGALKLMGPDVLVSSRDEPVFKLETGERRTGRTPDEAAPAVDEHVLRWAIVEFADARLEMATRSEWAIAAKGVDADWRGPALFTPQEGFLNTPRGSYVVEGKPARLTGELSGRFLPRLSGGEVTTLLQVQGDVEHTTLRLVEGPLGPRLMKDPDFQPLRLLVVASVVGVGVMAGGVSWLRRHPLAVLPRRREAPHAESLPFTVEDCMAAAAEAADDEDWPRAAEWLVRVRRLAPTSARTCADLAHAYCQMGQWEEGLRMYDEASRLSVDGEADFNAAVVALENGLPVEDVEERLVRALHRSPNYVVDVETDPSFAPLRGRPSFERIMREAWERADDVDASEGAPVRP